MVDIASVGFKGTVNELNWSDLGPLLGNDRATTGVADMVVTASPTKGRFDVSSGGLYGDGILGSIGASERIPDAALTPAAGQWYLLCQERDWGTRTSSFVVRNGPTGAASAPAAKVPDSFPDSFEDNPGSVADTALAWVWVGSGATQPVIVQLALPPESVYPRVGNSTDRNRLTGRLESSAPGRRFLQDSGIIWHRTDYGWSERYLAERSSGNPGGADVAGWYPFDGGLPYVRDWRKSDTIWSPSAGAWQGVTWDGSSPTARNANWDGKTLRPIVGGRYRFRGAIGARAGSGFLQVRLYKNGDANMTALSRQAGDTISVPFDFTVSLDRGERANIAVRSEVSRLAMDAKDGNGVLVTWLDIDYLGAA